MSRSASIIVTMVSALLLSACAIVLFHNPVSDAGPGTVDKRLVGMWYKGSARCDEELEMSCEDQELASRADWRETGASYYCDDVDERLYLYITEGSEDLTAFAVICGDDSFGHFVATLRSYTIGEHTYAVVQPITVAGSGYTLGGYLVLRYAFLDNDTLQMWGADTGSDIWGEDVLDGFPGSTEEVDEMISYHWVDGTITELEAYLSANDLEDDFWESDFGAVAVRIPIQPGADARPGIPDEKDEDEDEDEDGVGKPGEINPGDD